MSFEIENKRSVIFLSAILVLTLFTLCYNIGLEQGRESADEDFKKCVTVFEKCNDKLLGCKPVAAIQMREDFKTEFNMSEVQE